MEFPPKKLPVLLCLFIAFMNVEARRRKGVKCRNEAYWTQCPESDDSKRYYCCENSYGEMQCCVDVGMWNYWYYWALCPIVVLLLVSVGAWCCKLKNRQRTRINTSGVARGCSNQMVYYIDRSPPLPPPRPVKSDNPPTYEEIRKDGIDPKFIHISTISPAGPSAPPPYEVIQSVNGEDVNNK